jgi:hypothetical protein
MRWLPLIWTLVIIGGIVYVFVRQERERARSAPLRAEIEARVCFATTLDRVRILGTGGFGGTRGQWIAVMKGGPERLIVGTDAFQVVGPFGEYVFRGRESSIAFSQEPSRAAARDWIIVTGQSGTRQVQLAIGRKDALLPSAVTAPCPPQAPPPNPTAAEPDGRRVLSRGGAADHEVTPQAPLTGPGWRENSCGGFGEATRTSSRMLLTS